MHRLAYLVRHDLCMKSAGMFFHYKQVINGSRMYPGGDTTKVLSEEEITVPAGTFPGTYKLSKIIGYVYETYTQDSIWLTPNIGMTRCFQNEFSTAPVPGNGVWELTSYNLK